MRIGDSFASLAALQKRIHHLAHDRAGTDDCHLHNNVIETFWPQAWQARHLRAALHLKHAYGVGLLQGGINGGVVLRQMCKVHLVVIVMANQFERIFQHRHHAQAEQIHFDNAHVGTVFFVPLHHHAAGHGSRLQRNYGVELSLADDHSSRMLA